MLSAAPPLAPHEATEAQAALDEVHAAAALTKEARPEKISAVLHLPGAVGSRVVHFIRHGVGHHNVWGADWAKAAKLVRSWSQMQSIVKIVEPNLIVDNLAYLLSCYARNNTGQRIHRCRVPCGCAAHCHRDFTSAITAAETCSTAQGFCLYTSLCQPPTESS
jgi:hypothetical protein